MGSSPHPLIGYQERDKSCAETAVAGMRPYEPFFRIGVGILSAMLL